MLCCSKSKQILRIKKIIVCFFSRTYTHLYPLWSFRLHYYFLHVSNCLLHQWNLCTFREKRLPYIFLRSTRVYSAGPSDDIIPDLCCINTKAVGLKQKQLVHKLFGLGFLLFFWEGGLVGFFIDCSF